MEQAKPMKPEQRHPSFLSLDRHALGLDAEASEHVEACEACRSHVASIGRDVPVAAWVEEVLAAKRRGRWRMPLVRWGLGSAAVAAIALVLLVQSKGDVPFGAKGAPSVGVYVRRAGEVSLWDGRALLQSDDAIRLQVAAEGHRFVSVFSPGPGAALARLYAASVEPSGATLLSKAWQLDGPPETRIIVVLSAEPLPDVATRADLDGLVRRNRLWRTEIVLPVNEDPR